MASCAETAEPVLASSNIPTQTATKSFARSQANMVVECIGVLQCDEAARAVFEKTLTLKLTQNEAGHKLLHLLAVSSPFPVANPVRLAWRSESGDERWMWEFLNCQDAGFAIGRRRTARLMRAVQMWMVLDLFRS
jgi:hypothetical protein